MISLIWNEFLPIIANGARYNITRYPIASEAGSYHGTSANGFYKFRVASYLCQRNKA